jgi:CxxC-x17-CxxC domain-containing protein
MRNFNQDNRDGNKRGFRQSGFGGRTMDRQMHKAICAKCGNECQVPFKPTGEKPVFCSNCFEKKGPAEPRRYNDRNSGRSNFSDKQMYSVVCDGCGNECQVPFQPTNGKPVYCQQCFRKNSGPDHKNTDQFQEQFDKLNAKLDQILKTLASTSTVNAEPMVDKPPKSKKAVKKELAQEL